MADENIPTVDQLKKIPSGWTTNRWDYLFKLLRHQQAEIDLLKAAWPFSAIIEREDTE